jgi:phosphoribosylaminoimidazole (AIR) synthetase
LADCSTSSARAISDPVLVAAEPLFFLDYFACGQLALGQDAARVTYRGRLALTW